MALAEGAVGSVTGCAPAALCGCQETGASASIATRADADMERNEVTVATMTVEEGSRCTTTAPIISKSGGYIAATAAAIWKVTNMAALAKGVVGSMTGRAAVAWRGCQETRASALIATRADAGTEGKKVTAATIVVGEGNRRTKTAEAAT